MLTPFEVDKRVYELRQRYAMRDGRWDDVAKVRAGEISELVPEGLPVGFDHSFVANTIDVTAQDLAELIAPLPTFNCDNARKSDRAQKNAGLRTKIANYYVGKSRLRVQMHRGGQFYWTYGVIPFVIEPDFEVGCPTVRIDEPRGSYYELDLFGKTRYYAKVWSDTAGTLAAKFPEHASQILNRKEEMGYVLNESADTPLDVVKYFDEEQITLFLPDRKGPAGPLVLQSEPNTFGFVPVVIVERPSFDREVRGQFDEAMWIHIARVRMALWIMEATKKNVQAPTVVPQDVNRWAIGPDALIRTNSPNKAYKLETPVPQAAMGLQEILLRDVREGTRHPEVRSGNLDASIVTGQGVEALLGGFDTQLKAAQVIVGDGYERMIKLMFRMDEKAWPEMTKKISGSMNGTTYEALYKPSRDIAGNHAVEVTYGFAAGMDPARALVFLLQLRGDQDISRDFLQRQLPMDIDVEELQQQIDTEQFNDALKQAMFGMLGNLPVMAQQGMDPYEIISKVATVMQQRDKGVPLVDSMAKAFEPKPQPQTLGEAEAAQQPPGGPGGMPAAPGQAEMGPGGRPDLQQLLAGLSAGGGVNASASVRRQIPA